MNLKEFVDETLSEILAGIREAQAKEGGGAVGAEMDAVPGGKAHSNLLTMGYGGNYTIVEFDVSVSAERTAEGKAGIKVLSVAGIQGGGARTSAESSRVKFAVPMRVPVGDRVQALEGFKDPIKYPADPSV